MKIGIVGPCGAGKTTMARALVALGYDAHDCAQEHSHVQTMWQQITRPDILVFLDVSLESICARLGVDWEQAYLDEMNRRLTHARAHADFYVCTDALSPEAALARVLAFVVGTAQTRG
jgi:deoxyadenosine/deoxycytidine kinase